MPNLNINFRKPKEVGVFITFDETYHYIDEFGFDSERELIDFIKKNIGNGYYMVYEYLKQDNVYIFNPIISGDKEDF